MQLYFFDSANLKKILELQQVELEAQSNHFLSSSCPSKSPLSINCLFEYLLLNAKMLIQGIEFSVSIFFIQMFKTVLISLAV